MAKHGKMKFDNFEMDRTPKPLNHFQKVDTFLISTHRALSRQHKIKAGNITRTSPKIMFYAEIFEKFRSGDVEHPTHS